MYRKKRSDEVIHILSKSITTTSHQRVSFLNISLELQKIKFQLFLIGHWNKYQFKWFSQQIQSINLNCNMSLIQTSIVTLLVHFIQGGDDYWNEDFDENKNCAREEDIEKLRRETEPVRCASAARYGNLYLHSPLWFLINFLPRIS